MKDYKDIDHDSLMKESIDLFNMINQKSQRKHFDKNKEKYRNPEIAIGYEKTKASIVDTEGIETDEQNYFSYLYDLANNEDDFSDLSDLVFSEDEVTEIKNRSSQDIKAMEVITIDDDDDDDNDSVITIDDNKESKKVQKSKKDSYENRKALKKELKEERHQNAMKVQKLEKGLVDYSDSSENLNSSNEGALKQRKKRSRSPSPQNSPSSKANLKDECLELIQQSEDEFYCRMCDLPLNSLETYNSHINGRRHNKKWKMENLSETVVKTIPSSPVQEREKYPKPPAGVMRIEVDKQAKLQDIIEQRIHHAVLGYDLSTLIDLDSVIEIQAMDEIKYYCSRCDSPCSSSSILPHLTGFKHRMNNLKYFKRKDHELLKNQSKFRIEDKVDSILRHLQKRLGLGHMVVEKDVHLTESESRFNGTRIEESTSKDMAVPSTSSRNMDVPFQERYIKSTIPDTSRSGYYCKYCKSHMMDKRMWDQHIRGTRHLKNVQKMPGMYPSKCKTVSVHVRKARLLEKLKKVFEPVVGLDQIEELQNHETKSETYKCFLCGGCFSCSAIIDHLLCTKHRVKYLDYIDHPKRINADSMSEAELTVRARRICEEIEKEVGRGKPSVHVTKDSLSVI